MKKFVLFVFAIAGLAIVAGSLHAQKNRKPGKPPGPPLLRVLDTNGDGELSSREIDRAPKQLRKLDTNRDGRVTTDEISPITNVPPLGQPQVQKKRGNMFDELFKSDTDGDNMLSQEELGERFAPMFAQVDENRDGYVSKEEIKNAVSNFQGNPNADD